MGFGQANFVATGGGTRDHTVRFWNLLDGRAHYTLDTQSQVRSFDNFHILISILFEVTGILFNKAHGEMITGHGAPKPGIRVWHHEPHKIKKFEMNAELNDGQSGRVLQLCQSPCGEYVMAASQVENLK